MMVDIILAVYNGEKYLKELLDSILNQSFSDFKIIAGDDNSRDGSKSVLEEYSKKFPGKFELHFFDFEKSCAKDNFLRLLEYSHSDFIMFADQDDIWKENKIEEALKALKNEDSSIPLLYHTDLEVVDDYRNTIEPSMFSMQKLPKECMFSNLLCQNNVTGCTVMINAALRDMVCFNNKDNIIMHDWWLALIAKAFGKTVFDNAAHIEYRQHGNNEVGAKDVDSYEYLSGRLKNTDDVKKNIQDTYVQAKEFYDCFKDKLCDEHKEIAHAYGEFLTVGKKEKLKRLKKYNLWKNTAKRRLAQILWG